MSATSSISGFRLRLLIGMMLVVCAVTGLALWIAQNKVSTSVRQQMQQAFEGEISTLHRAWEVRHAALVERARSLAGKPRIHAALEDNALDLLYPNAEDELRDVMEASSDHPLQARFYRFLDADGKVIATAATVDAGMLDTDEEAQLSSAKLQGSQQAGYLFHSTGIDEIIAAPIISTDTNEVIASIVLGFRPADSDNRSPGVMAGIRTNGKIYLPNISAKVSESLEATIEKTPAGSNSEIIIDGVPHLVFSQLLNPDSKLPPAYEVCVYSLADAEIRNQHLRTQILGAGAFLLLGAGFASHAIASKLSKPVEQLAVDSAKNELQREKAESALELASEALQRSMRFSADTSHQLKTPITVIRAGLEELQHQPGVTNTMHEEISGLISQTVKLSSMVHDLLLLSRLDDGRLQLEMASIDLTTYIDSLVDDLSVVPNASDFEVVVNVPRELRILGEKRYVAMILQNLMENAWKYNLPHGTIAISARDLGKKIALCVGNSSNDIPAEAQKHIFERFHRAAAAENVPGHGLGLNIARKLALLHDGDLRLVRSTGGWTEFEVLFLNASVGISV